MAVSTVEDELCDASGVEPRDDESRIGFLIRLAKRVERIPDAAWRQLSPAAQDWTLAASKSIENGSGWIKDFGGSRVAEPRQVAAAKPVEVGPPLTGVKAEIKQLLLDDPSISADAIIEKLAKRGTPPSKFTVASIRADFRHSLKFLIQKGLLHGVKI